MAGTKKSTSGPGPLKRKRATGDEGAKAIEHAPKSAKVISDGDLKQDHAGAEDKQDARLEENIDINGDFALMSTDILADHISQKTKHHNDDLSMVELEERRIPAAAIRDTTDFEAARTIDNLPDFLRHVASPARKASDLDKTVKTAGKPHTLVVTAAGLRAADLTRGLRLFQTKDVKITKLFAKHIKLKEAKDLVRKTRIGIGVGTPHRIDELLEDGALSSTNLERIVVDVSHIDQKKRGILDQKEVQPQLITLLNRPELKDRYGATTKPLELVFF